MQKLQKLGRIACFFLQLPLDLSNLSREHLSIAFTGMYALFTVAITLTGALSSFTTDYSSSIDYFGSVDFRIYHILDIFAYSMNILYLIYMISGVFFTNNMKSDKMGENPKVYSIHDPPSFSLKY